MAQRISATATEADTSGDQMDIGNVDEQEIKPNHGEDSSQRSFALTPVSPPMPPGSQQAPQAESPALATQRSKTPNPNIRCFTCNQIGHPSFLCPMKDTKGGKGGKGGNQPQGWRPPGAKGWNSKGWNQKGKGKGKGGKGAYALEEWTGFSDEDWYGSSFCGMCE